MGRIPKAEKVKAIEVLRNNGDEMLVDEDISLLEEENSNSSYNKRFEKRLELDRNLKMLAENVFKSCGDGATGDNQASSSSVSSATTPPTPKQALTTKKMQAAAVNKTSLVLPNKNSAASIGESELIAIIDNIDATQSSVVSPASLNQKSSIVLDSNEDYMSRFLKLLFERAEKYISL